MNSLKSALISFAAMAVVGFTSAVQGATATDTFAVTISIDGTCSIAATDIAFGNVASDLATATNANGTITVNCTLYTPYQIGLDVGLNDNAGTRRMFDGGTGYVPYELYSEATYTTVWGDTLDTDTVTGTGTGADEAYTVYGQVPDTTGATTGGYSDTVTATITF